MSIEKNYRNKNAAKMRALNKQAKIAEENYPCNYKKKYVKKLEAEIAARLETMKALVELFIYKCPFCKYYHLTSSPKRSK